MEEQGFRQSLITSNIWKNERQSSKITVFLIFVKYGLKFVMWVIFIAWLALVFLFPSNFAYDFFVLWIEMTQTTCFGVAGSVFMLFMAPLLVVTLIGAIYIKLFPANHTSLRKKRRLLLWDLSTFPVLVDGPLRVVCAAEFLWIALFTSYIVWATSSFVLQELTTVSEVVAPFKEKCYLFFQMIGFDLALIGIFLIGFLFLPISRGSILLRLIEVPIEHAVKYHVWLGHITMACFTLHGLCFLASWALDGTLLYQITRWQSSGVAYLPGVITLLAGLLMWVTSLHPVRRSYFEIFFYTHQLYIVFLVFLAMHVSDFTLYIAGGGIFLFLIDRFLRFCQSRPTVDVVSAKCLPCGVVELTLAIPQNIRYNALSFVFIQVRGLSWLQWHPFSVSSSPLDGKRHVSVLIKALGQWTKKLRESLMDVQDCNDTYFSEGYPAMISASVEGPYGHETPYFLRYGHLILIAGGIGVSPFIATLRDILHRHHKNQTKTSLPIHILLVWSVKTSDELCLLDMIDMATICPSFSKDLDLEIQTYVTQESEPPLEEGNTSDMNTVLTFSEMHPKRVVSGLVGTGDTVWFGLYSLSSTIGFIVLVALVKSCLSWESYEYYTWYQGLCGIICMFASVILCGGPVVILWHIYQGKFSDQDVQSDGRSRGCSNRFEENTALPLEAPEFTRSQYGPTYYGRRPNFEEIFDYVSDEWRNVEVGVVVCGPVGLQSSIAAECRSRNLRGQLGTPMFHFHSHSFEF